ncbi:hypothetical protein TNCV_3547671 [Trichonephila clavipes]|nr:hypothetical protein TNCV_3547671 [Trichonephila clavipes]
MTEYYFSYKNTNRKIVKLNASTTMSDCWSVDFFKAANREHSRSYESEIEVCTYNCSLPIPAALRVHAINLRTQSRAIARRADPQHLFSPSVGV